MSATEKIITYKQYYEYFVFQGKFVMKTYRRMGVHGIYTEGQCLQYYDHNLEIITHLTL